MTEQKRPDIRYLTIEPGRISLHGIALTDGEYAVLRAIAERMKVQVSAEGRERRGDMLERVLGAIEC